MLAFGVASSTSYHQQGKMEMFKLLFKVFNGVETRDDVNAGLHFRKLQDDVNQTCQALKAAFLQDQGSSATACTCGETFDAEAIELSCTNVCNLCDQGLGICGTQSLLVRYSSSNQTGALQATLIHASVKYSGNRDDVLSSEIILDIDSGEPISCTVGVNNQTCSECRVTSNCTAGSYYYDCSNIESNAVFDQCSEGTSKISPSSVFIGLNENYFNFNECSNSTLAPGVEITPAPFFKSESPVPTPTQSMAPVLEAMTPAPSTPTMPVGTPTTSVSVPPTVASGGQPQIDLIPFQVVGSAADLNEEQLSYTLGTYLYETMLNYPGLNTLQEVVLVSSTKNNLRELGNKVHRTLQNNFTVDYTGTAYFVLEASAPSQADVHTAQVAALDDIGSMQGYIDFDTAVGTDVRVIAVAIEEANTPAPTPTVDSSACHSLKGANAISSILFVLLLGLFVQ